MCLVLRFFLLLCVLARCAQAASPGNVVLENPLFRLVVSHQGQSLSFVDLSTGKDYLLNDHPTACASVHVNGAEYTVAEAALAGSRLTLWFGGCGVAASLQVEVRAYAIRLTVESVSGPEPDSLEFLHVPLSLAGRPDEPFSACVLALNLFTRVDALPALQTDLRASCQPKFGLRGASIAIVAAPMARILPCLQDTLANLSQLPVCKAAGPWARDIPFNHGSYLFNFGSLTETNVDEWIAMTRSLGFNQIDNHGGSAFFRFGDMELNREKWPDGWRGWSRIVARLHEAGVGSIFHTYAFFIDKKSKYVTPVPDSRLDAFRTLTLAEPLDPDSTELTVRESTRGLNTVTGFFVHNSVVLQLGDELVTFSAVSQEAPWRFSGLRRGALGTHAIAHPRGAPVRHLKECFGLFVPDPESSLFEEIAANHAAVVNQCKFDGIYLDAIDGSSILRGDDEAWYWASKFVVEIQKRLSRPVGMEMSSMWHQFWQYRTRWQAWDYPQRGHKRFIDLHAQAVNGGLLLPLHLGWWNFQSFNPPQVEPSYPDVMENLAARLIGWDAGISLTGAIDRDALRKTPLFQRAVNTLRLCEDLRHAGAFNEATKARLREPQAEFTLFTNSLGLVRFRRSSSSPQTIATAEPWTMSWRLTNSFAPQPLRFRLESLISAGSATGTNRQLLATLGTAENGDWKTTTANGVTLKWQPAAEPGEWCAVLVATNAGAVGRNAAWARLERHFDPCLNLQNHQALAIDVEGDGSGALLALRLESSQHLSFGAVADRYLTLDFTGRRTATLVETESARWSDYVWNDGKSAYNLYRETIDFRNIESLSVCLQNLPPGRVVTCRLGPLRGVPLEASHLQNPRLRVNGAQLELPADLPSGAWVEGNGPQDCAVYDKTGKCIERLSPRGDWPRLDQGVTTLEFSCDPVTGPSPRARLTVFCLGDEL